MIQVTPELSFADSEWLKLQLALEEGEDRASLEDTSGAHWDIAYACRGNDEALRLERDFPRLVVRLDDAQVKALLPQDEPPLPW